MSNLVAPQLTNPSELRSNTILAREEESMSTNSDEFMDVVDENENINHLVDAMETLNLEEEDDDETVIQAPTITYRCIGEQKWDYGINILKERIHTA